MMGEPLGVTSRCLLTSVHETASCLLSRRRGGRIEKSPPHPDLFPEVAMKSAVKLLLPTLAAPALAGCGADLAPIPTALR